MTHIMKIKSLLTTALALTGFALCQAAPKHSDALEEAGAVRKIIEKVNNYWQNNNRPEVRSFWDNAAYHTGNMEACRLTGNQEWLDYSRRWAEHNEWKGAKSDDRSKWKYNYGETDEHVLFGDWQICFQTYADLYNILPDERRIKRAKEVMEYEMSTPRNDYWWWADGLYMVMPVMTKLHNITGNPQYLEKLYDYLLVADSIMYDAETGLYFRDGKYVYPKHKSANGKKDFWARGDGWVLAGLAKVLQDLPADYTHRKFFEDKYRRLADAVVACQQPDGYWSRSMLDEAHAPGPETSGTAFFTYGLLWGINNGYLPDAKYLDAAKKGWKYLTGTALQPDGRVGYVQPIGEKAIPGQVVDANSTSNFGVGAFLLAACEYTRYLEQLANGDHALLPARTQFRAGDGAWCWFADPRALHYATPDGRIDATYMGYIDNHGNIKATQYDFARRRQTEVLVRSAFQPDDHNNPSFLALPDGRIMIFYSRHTDEPCFYYRVSQKPGDITTLGAEHRLATADNTTYPSPFILSSDPEHIYLCWRGINWHPTIGRLTLPDANDEVKFDMGPYQMVQSTGARPYAKYTSNGRDRIYLAYTTGHPDNEMPNWLYCNYIDIPSLTLRDIEGNKLSSIADGPFAVNKTSEYLRKYPATVVDASDCRDWLSQIAVDQNGVPTIAMTRISDDKKSHNYYVARRVGDKWRLSHVAYAGGHFHQTPRLELCYSGGMAIDEADPNILYCSLPVGGVYEIVKYTIDENGEVKAAEQITSGSTLNNSRPFCIAGSVGSPLRLGWMNGNYYDWIVSKDRPLGFPTTIVTDFAGFDTKALPLPSSGKFTPGKDFEYTAVIEPRKGGRMIDLGALSYWIDKNTLKPEIRFKKKKYTSGNMLATSDNWQLNPRSTNGAWYAPAIPEKATVTLRYEDGELSVFVNGALDQKIRLEPSRRTPKVFAVNNPDYKLSPYTGMTRKHWLEAATYLLDGAFQYISGLDDPMYFPKQLDKTYPRDDGAVPVAKLEGLARTLFIAAPLLRENPDPTLNGIKVADYYNHQIKNLVKRGSTSYIAHRTGGPSQTLLELGSICVSLKIAQPALWDTYRKREKDALASLFLSYGEGPTIGSNWQFFNAFILSFLKDQGYNVNDDYLRKNLEKLLALYRGEGWYNDAPAYDYYSMWAFQTYGPFLAHYYRDQYPDLADKFVANQHDLVDNYPYMFARDGRMNMWGRSLPYRFAAVSPFAFLEYNDKDGDIDYGWLRHISSASLLQFMQHPEFLQDGIPTMGYFGVFAPCVQIYSCRGSVFWLGKAFFNLLLPEDSKYWQAVENEGPWGKELAKGNVYNKFQPATNLMITNYPNSGASEMRSWCHESVEKDWQKFRSSENYNKLAYNTEFPWMADGANGEISMNYGTVNRHGEWEVLRLYDFVSNHDGVYRRDAVLETDSTARYRLADITLPDGVLRVDRATLPEGTPLRLGCYSLPELGNGLKSETRKLSNGTTATIVSNGEYSLAVVPLYGWDGTTVLRPLGLHPQSRECAVIANDAKGSGTYLTLHLWKKGGKFSNSELMPVKTWSVTPERIDLTLADGTTKTVKD